MAVKKKVKLKPKALKSVKIVGIIISVILICFVIYFINYYALIKLDYSKEAAKNIMMKFKKQDVVKIGKNKTLNKAFESPNYNDANFSIYAKIEYHNHKDLIKNINTLVKVGYSKDEINMILSHGSNEDVKEFAKKEKIKYLEEFYTISYAKLKYYDRYVNYMDKSREDEENSVLYVNLDLDKPNYQNYQEVTEFSYTMLVNKHHHLDEKFVPEHLVEIEDEYTTEGDVKLNNQAAYYAKKMINDAKKQGYNLVINSAYRSYSEQEEVVNTYKGLYGDSYVEKYVLQPGFSEHQTGLGIDFNSADTLSFSLSDEYDWLEDNCYKYGFIHRFPSKYEDITGINSEAWHYRYVGKKIAKYIYDNDITLEEYYVKFLDKD